MVCINKPSHIEVTFDYSWNLTVYIHNIVNQHFDNFCFVVDIILLNSFQSLSVFLSRVSSLSWFWIDLSLPFSKLLLIFSLMLFFVLIELRDAIFFHTLQFSDSKSNKLVYLFTYFALWAAWIFLFTSFSACISFWTLYSIFLILLYLTIGFCRNLFQ